MIYPVTPLYAFIGTGDKVAMYTLRVMYECEVVVEGKNHIVLRDYYIQNLSNDKAKAETKANEFAQYEGIPFKGDASFELNEIRRLNAEESEANKRAYQEAIEAAEKAEFQRFEAAVADKVFIIGKYLGQTAEEVANIDMDYLFYLNTSDATGTSQYAVNVKIAKDYIAANNIQSPGFVGEVGETLVVMVTLKSIFSFYGAYGISYAFTCQTDAGESISFFTTSKKLLALENGDKFKLESIVSEHSVYNGRNQTKVKKPKIAK